MPQTLTPANLAYIVQKTNFTASLQLVSHGHGGKQCTRTKHSSSCPVHTAFVRCSRLRGTDQYLCQHLKVK